MTTSSFKVSKPKRIARRTVTQVECDGHRFKVAVWPVTDPDESQPNPVIHFGQVVTQPQGEYIGTVSGRNYGDWTFTPSAESAAAYTAYSLRTAVRYGIQQYIAQQREGE